ncbi:DUF2913 family protein [Kosakonia sp. S42]|uniref:DUF2913 family protein n=1 Tax=Kosakonia sp. S42 TaxID=2767458 RepID=UPI00190D17DC|nr:DUF2913 family protein [Kosakonia sp. S42]MBK0018742.1 DUF2913 family protein [Kosakonia sp. S42]
MTEHPGNISPSARMAWCALVALAMARRDGIVSLPGSEALFLQRWLVTAQKQKRFPKSTADDLAALLEYARTPGTSARLLAQLERLWLTGNRSPRGETGLHRFTRVTEILKAAGWDNAVVSPRDLKSGAADDYRCASGFYVTRTALSTGFNQAGALVHPVNIRVRGEAEVFMRTLAQQSLSATASSLPDGQTRVTLIPRAQ